MSQYFAGLTFLITRPALQSTKLSARITALGGQCLLFPTIDIIPLAQQEELSAIVRQFSRINKIIFVSSNAVTTVMPLWPKNTQSPEIFAVGSGTAAALANYAISAKIPPENAFNSEGVLALPELQTLAQQTIVIFKGLGGRSLLAETLRERGATVQEISVYKRSCPVVAMTALLRQWQQTHLDFIISTSCESLENLYTLAGHEGQTWLQEQQLLLISPRMQLLAVQLGFKPSPILAENASDQAILNAALGFVDKTSAISQIRTVK